MTDMTQEEGHCGAQIKAATDAIEKQMKTSDLVFYDSHQAERRAKARRYAEAAIKAASEYTT
jgi:hypothetical protein